MNILQCLLLLCIISFYFLVENFDLSFVSFQKFTLLDNNVPEMFNMTLMFWINTLKAEKMIVLSYTVNLTEEFELMVEREKITLQVQQSKKYEVLLLC